MQNHATDAVCKTGIMRLYPTFFKVAFSWMDAELAHTLGFAGIKVLHRSDVVLAPERGGPGCVALGVRLPLADWLVPLDLDLDAPGLSSRLAAAAPRRSAVQTAPDWHRLRAPGALNRLDPGLEGWEETRELLRTASLIP